MIDEIATFKKFGYTSNELLSKSHKPIIAICLNCGQYRDLPKKDYHDLCAFCSYKAIPRSAIWKASASKARKGRPKSVVHRAAISKAKMGIFHTEEAKKKMSEAKKGHTLSDDQKVKISKALKGVPKPPRSSTHCRAISAGNKGLHSGEKNGNYGKKFPEKHRQKLSAAKQGIPYEKWESFVSNNPYCPKFDEACREANRDKYNRMCFVCGLPESENITSSGKHKKLSVHHVDMNRKQGCDGHKWEIIPVCLHCHGTLHNKKMVSHIQSVLENETTA